MYRIRQTFPKEIFGCKNINKDFRKKKINDFDNNSQGGR